MSKSIVFAYHNVGVRCLSVLLAHGVDVVRVITHTDNPGETIWFDSVAELAAVHDIPVITPEDPNDAALVAELAALQPDFLFSFYYRQMLKAPLLALPGRGAFNMHGSLLPKYRGRVPVNWAIIHGERETGATLHQMVEKPDAGGIVAQQAVPILPDDSALEVFNKVSVAAEMALDRALPLLLSGQAVPQPQELAAGSYFGGRKEEDGRIDWSRPASEIHNLIRAVAPPYPGAFFDTANSRVRILRSIHADSAQNPRFGRPTLYSHDARLFAECADGQILRLLAVELGGATRVPLSAGDPFKSIFGNSAVPLL
ncbi:MAG: formyltransferase [Burkholderiaceae bacterium]|nr:formyltransferase [Sulfuritalea sp.]MCF8175618.1 formyltransferase [Burkholderiaceae bacterium]